MRSLTLRTHNNQPAGPAGGVLPCSLTLSVTAGQQFLPHLLQLKEGSKQTAPMQLDRHI